MSGAGVCGASTFDRTTERRRRRKEKEKEKGLVGWCWKDLKKEREKDAGERQTDVFDAVACEDHVPSHEILLGEGVKVEFTIGICLPLDLSLDGIKVDCELSRLEKGVELRFRGLLVNRSTDQQINRSTDQHHRSRLQVSVEIKRKARERHKRA